MNDNSSKVIDVDINEILPNRFQPRIKFNEEEILELSDSIKEHGVIQPLVVRPIGDKYEIVAGERRYKASVLAGKDSVPVIVKNLNDKDSAEIALIENVQRKNLTPIEEALSYKKILDMGYITQENLAIKLGKSQPAVANKIRLLNLSDEVQEALLENRISERHARSLLKLSTSELQNKMLNRIITERLTVRKTDEEINKINNSEDEENSDTQKIIEKGEVDMNNNMFGMPNVPQTPQEPTPSFDIFGMGNNQQVQPQVPTPEPVVQPNFDIFGGNNQTTQPTIEPQSVVEPSIPIAEPSIVSPMIEPQVSTPEVAVPPVGPGLPGYETPQIPQMPTMGVAMPEIPIVEPSIVSPMVEPQASTPEVAVPPVGPGLPGYETPQIPQMPTVESVMPPAEISIPSFEPEVPQTSPIMESPVAPEPIPVVQQSENTFSFGNPIMNSTEQAVQPEVTTVPEFKMPEPIIITDYSKQYDPIMPPSPENIQPTVDFKEVIGAIRECSNKIEQYGFKIEVDEYDLTNLYQVIFKIEK